MSQYNDDEIFELYYKGVAKEHLINMAKEFDTFRMNNDIEVETSRLDNWFRGFNRRIKKKNKGKSKWVQIASRHKVAVVLSFIVLSIFLSYSVEAIRIRVFNLVIDVQDKYTEFHLEENNTTVVEGTDYKADNMEYYPTYLPEGYYLEESMGEDELVTTIYTNGTEELYLVVSASNGINMIDTENATVTETKVGQYDGYIIKKEGEITVFWRNADSTFQVLGESSEEEILRIVHSIKK